MTKLDRLIFCAKHSSRGFFVISDLFYFLVYQYKTNHHYPNNGTHLVNFLRLWARLYKSLLQFRFQKGWCQMIDRVFWSQVNAAWSEENDVVFAEKDKIRLRILQTVLLTLFQNGSADWVFPMSKPFRGFQGCLAYPYPR